jgi:hypothetical protein
MKGGPNGRRGLTETAVHQGLLPMARDRALLFVLLDCLWESLLSHLDRRDLALAGSLVRGHKLLADRGSRLAGRHKHHRRYPNDPQRAKAERLAGLGEAECLDPLVVRARRDQEGDGLVGDELQRAGGGLGLVGNELRRAGGGLVGDGLGAWHLGHFGTSAGKTLVVILIENHEQPRVHALSNKP